MFNECPRKRSIPNQKVLQIQRTTPHFFLQIVYCPHRLIADERIFKCCADVNWILDVIKKYHSKLEYFGYVDAQHFCLKGVDYALVGMLMDEQLLKLTLTNGIYILNLTITKILWNSRFEIKEFIPSKQFLTRLFLRKNIPSVLIYNLLMFLEPQKKMNFDLQMGVFCSLARIVKVECL